MVDGSAYERELKAILQSGSYRGVRFRPYVVVRAAGSHGFDLVAMRDGEAIPIEVKASHEASIPFSSASGYAQRQYEELVDTIRRTGMPLLYAYRRIGVRDGCAWRLFAARVTVGIAIPIPPVGLTSQGGVVLRWYDGCQLGALLYSLSCMRDSAPPSIDARPGAEVQQATAGELGGGPTLQRSSSAPATDTQEGDKQLDNLTTTCVGREL